MKSKFIIKDWAGNVCFKGKTFPSFEDAWDFIYAKDPCPSEKQESNWYSDYCVVKDVKNMKTKIITVTDRNHSIRLRKIKLTVPYDIWFNCNYSVQAKLLKAKTMTIAQFCTTSNFRMYQVFQWMKNKDLIRIRSFLDNGSKRQKTAMYFIDLILSQR